MCGRDKPPPSGGTGPARTIDSNPTMKCTLRMPRNARATVAVNSELWRGPPTVLTLIGNTPLLRLKKVRTEYPEVEFCANAECANPGGSVKDRPAMNIILEA